MSLFNEDENKDKTIQDFENGKEIIRNINKELKEKQKIYNEKDEYLEKLYQDNIGSIVYKFKFIKKDILNSIPKVNLFSGQKYVLAGDKDRQKRMRLDRRGFNIKLGFNDYYDNISKFDENDLKILLDGIERNKEYILSQANSREMCEKVIEGLHKIDEGNRIYWQMDDKKRNIFRLYIEESPEKEELKKYEGLMISLEMTDNRNITRKLWSNCKEEMKELLNERLEKMRPQLKELDKINEELKEVKNMLNFTAELNNK